MNCPRHLDSRRHNANLDAPLPVGNNDKMRIVSTDFINLGCNGDGTTGVEERDCFCRKSNPNRSRTNLPNSFDEEAGIDTLF